MQSRSCRRSNHRQAPGDFSELAQWQAEVERQLLSGTQVAQPLGRNWHGPFLHGCGDETPGVVTFRVLAISMAQPSFNARRAPKIAMLKIVLSSVLALATSRVDAYPMQSFCCGLCTVLETDDGDLGR